MRTKKADLYIDLDPGWQDWSTACVYGGSDKPLNPVIKGSKRVRVTVELPEVPWPHDAEGKFVAVQEVQP
jgi:hypothetical protein